MSKSYSIRAIHLAKLQEIKRDIQARQATHNKREAILRDQEAAAYQEWQTWRANCKPIKGKQGRLL